AAQRRGRVEGVSCEAGPAMTSRTTMTRARFASLSIALLLVIGLPLAQTRKSLDIYVVDVEGGNATLYVAPSGESVLIDTGNGGAAGSRDPDRIMAAVKEAGLTQ